MGGETDLDTLMRGLRPELVDGVYVFATVTAVPDGVSPRMVFEEAEGTTLILLRAEAEAHGIDYQFPSRMITLRIHSSLEAVGLMAHIATALAAQNMGVNPVAGYYHDHLFVPESRAEDAMAVLHKIAAGTA